jgi:hypothetical protein
MLPLDTQLDFPDMDRFSYSTGSREPSVQKSDIQPAE